VDDESDSDFPTTTESFIPLMEDPESSSEDEEEAESDANASSSNASDFTSISSGFLEISDEIICEGGCSYRELCCSMLSVLFGHSSTDALKLAVFQCLNLAFGKRHFPDTHYFLKKLLRPILSRADFHLYCPKCNLYLGKLTSNVKEIKCSGCNENIKKSEADGNFFVSNNITQALEKIVKNSKNVPLSERPSASDIQDVSDGSTHKSLVAINGDIWTYNFFSDGAPVFSNSKRGMWLTFIGPNFVPIYLR